MIIFETLMIILYMVNPILAFMFSIVFFGSILLNKQTNIYYKILKLILVSTPLFSISIIGNKLHHIFSWTYIFLFIYLVILIADLIKGKYHLQKNFLFIMLFIFILLLQCFINNNIFSNLIEFFQIIVMIIPISLTYYAKKYLKEKLPSDFVNTIKKTIEDITIAMSFAVIVEYLLYNYFNIIIGNISIHSQRIIYDTIFSGYSILSIFLGIGIVLYIYEFIKQKKKLKIINLIIISIAILLNSARTGLVSAGLVSGILILKNSIKKRKINLKNIFILVVMGIGMLIMLYMLFQRRGDTTIFTSSGRENTYEYALNLIKNDFKIFAFGNGLSFNGYEYIIPHNFIIQTWLTNGIVVLMITLLLLYKLLKTLKNNMFIYISLCTIIGAMFTTDIYANTFFTTYAIAGLLYEDKFKNTLK